LAKPKAVVLFGRVPAGASFDEQDVLMEAATVSRALRALGFEPVELPLTLDLRRAASALRRLAPRFVFNLVESLEGQDRLAHLAPALLDSLGLPYTGSRTEALFLTSNKLLAKGELRRAALPTPEWAPVEGPGLLEPAFAPPYIVKSVWEHASIGLTGASVAHDGQSLAEELRRRRTGGRERSLYVEAFIEGREFNLALLQGEHGRGPAIPQVLPPAEIEFQAFPEGKPKIVDYAAKWESGSQEYIKTPRRFDFPDRDAELLETLSRNALACWQLFGLGGYARVDFRVDSSGRPWILEINANPCLSPDAGFLAAAGRAGLDETRVIERIVQGCLSA
jgi:D-alanine-D-alanine ligase